MALGKGVVAQVDGQDVTTQEVDRQAREMLQQQFPRGGEQAKALLPFFASRAAENLIGEKAVLAEARRLGLRVSDEELRDELQHGRYANVFFPEGNFIGEAEYQAKITQADLTVALFEQTVKDEILFGKLRDLVITASSVSDAEIRREFVQQNSKVKFEYAVLRQEDLLKSLHPADAELKAYYERNKASYNNAIPEKRKIRYTVIDSAKVEAATLVTPQELEDYYDQHREEFRVSEQVNVRHILIKTPQPGPDGKARSRRRGGSPPEGGGYFEAGQCRRATSPSSPRSILRTRGAPKTAVRSAGLAGVAPILNLKRLHFPCLRAGRAG